MTETITLNKRLILVLILAFIVGLVFILFFNVSNLLFGGDAFYYLELRDRVLDGDFWLLERESVFVAPLYPWFLAFVGLVFNKEFFWIYLVQTIIGVLNIFILYKISLNFLSQKHALLVSIFYIIYLPLLFLQAWVHPILLSIFFILLATNFLFKAIKSEKITEFIFSGALFSLAVLTRSVILYFPFLIFLVLIFYKKQLWKKYLIFLAVFVVLILPWSVRNVSLGQGGIRELVIVGQGQELKAVTGFKESFLVWEMDKVKGKLEAVGKAFLYPHLFSFAYSYDGQPPEQGNSLFDFLRQPRVLVTGFMFLIHFVLVSLFVVASFRFLKKLVRSGIGGPVDIFRLGVLLFVFYITASLVLVGTTSCDICYSYYLLPALPMITLLAAEFFKNGQFIR